MPERSAAEKATERSASAALAGRIALLRREELRASRVSDYSRDLPERRPCARPRSTSTHEHHARKGRANSRRPSRTIPGAVFGRPAIRQGRTATSASLHWGTTSPRAETDRALRGQKSGPAGLVGELCRRTLHLVPKRIERYYRGAAGKRALRHLTTRAYKPHITLTTPSLPFLSPPRSSGISPNRVVRDWCLAKFGSSALSVGAHHLAVDDGKIQHVASTARLTIRRQGGYRGCLWRWCGRALTGRHQRGRPLAGLSNPPEEVLHAPAPGRRLIG